MKTLFKAIAEYKPKFKRGDLVNVFFQGKYYVGQYDKFDPEYGYHFVKFPVANERGNITLQSSGFTEKQVFEL